MAAMESRSLLEASSAPEPNTSFKLSASHTRVASQTGFSDRAFKPSLQVVAVRHLRIAAAPTSLPGGVHEQRGNWVGISTKRNRTRGSRCERTSTPTTLA